MELSGSNLDSLSQIDEIDPHAGDVDVTLLQHMPSMTPAERLDYHDAVRRSALEMRRAGRETLWHHRIRLSRP
jgi:hypothetical protein